MAAQLLTYFGTFFGPALTFPWIYTTWQQHRKESKKKENEKKEAEIDKLKRRIEELEAQQITRKWWEFWK